MAGQNSLEDLHRLLESVAGTLGPWVGLVAQYENVLHQVDVTL
jgi:hypothetical protein